MRHETIDLELVIEKNGLDRRDVAAKLFPNNAYQTTALQRVIKGESELTTSQIVTLSHIVGCPVGELFSYNSGWTMKSTDRSVIRFTNGEYVAILNTQTFITHIFKGDIEIGDTAISTYTVPLSVYLQTIKDFIHKNQI